MDRPFMRSSIRPNDRAVVFTSGVPGRRPVLGAKIMADPTRPFDQDREKIALRFQMVRADLVRFRLRVEPSQINSTVRAGAVEGDSAGCKQFILEGQRTDFAGVVSRHFVAPN